MSISSRVGIWNATVAVAYLLMGTDAHAQFKPRVKPPVVTPPIVKPPKPPVVVRPPKPVPTPRPTPNPAPVVIKIRPNLQIIEPYVPPPAYDNPPANNGNFFIPDNQNGDSSTTDPGMAEPDLSTIEPDLGTTEPGISTIEPDLNAQPIETIDDFNTAIANEPTNAWLYEGRGTLWGKQGEYESAVADFDQAITLDPDLAAAYNSRAWLRATCPEDKYRDGMKAYKDAKRACELTQWSEANLVDTLAAAFAELGDFNNAVKIGQRAVKLCGDDPATKAELEAHVRMFQARQPIREAPETTGTDVTPVPAQ